MILVVGAGVAGLSCALAAVARGADVVLATPGRLRDGGNTALAQGGIAAAVGPGDTAEAHLADTLSAGAGIVNTAAARVLTTEGARIVRELLDAGLPVDRASDGPSASGLRARMVCRVSSTRAVTAPGRPCTRSLRTARSPRKQPAGSSSARRSRSLRSSSRPARSSVHDCGQPLHSLGCRLRQAR